MKHILILSALLLSSSAFAGKKDLDTSAIQLSLAVGDITAQRQQIETKLTQVEYVELTKDNRAALNEQFALLGASSLPADQAKAAETRINSILQQTFADSKLVCTFEKPLGSNMKQRSCVTVAAKKRSYGKTQRDLEMQKMPSNPYGSN